VKRVLFYALEAFVWIGEGVVLVCLLPGILVHKLLRREK
jgi:hypothetical protein